MATEVASINDWFCWSLNQLSREFGIARETVQRRLRDANIAPAGERRGHPVYGVGQAAKAILMPQISEGAATNDPDRMTPKERADWYKSENDRIKYERESGNAIYKNDAREQMAFIAKTGLQVLENLPDILERDYRLQPEIIESVESRIDALREQWAELLEELE